MSATFEFMIKNCYNLREKFSAFNNFFTNSFFYHED